MSLCSTTYQSAIKLLASKAHYVEVYINKSLHLALGYLSADIICSEKRTVFRERSSRKTVSFEEQIMSKDKYPSIFSPQMETIVFIILQIFYATRAVLKTGVYYRKIHYLTREFRVKLHLKTDIARIAMR